MNQKALCAKINDGELDRVFSKLYSDIPRARSRYNEILSMHENTYGERGELLLFSTPGRTEISGNHTDHQQGRVLAGSVDLDIIAAVSKNNDNMVRILSKGHRLDEIDISSLQKRDNEKNHAASLIRGIAAKMSEQGCVISGFDAYTISDVLTGSGLSSSAAFEVLVATIMNNLFNDDKLPPIELAKISQYAEREYFGKPSGLMDQSACASGGCVEIDFKDPSAPILSQIDFDLSSHGYSLVIVNTGANHSDLTDDYASVPRDMNAVAKLLGGSVLREVNEATFMNEISNIRKKVGDKAVLRALHFFAENERVPLAASALRKRDIDSFFEQITASGNSSFKFLQNVYSDSNPNEQSVSLALCVSEKALAGSKGVCRVHGGGFAGTIQAFVPKERLESYVEALENALGKGCCYVLTIRAQGSVRVY